MFVFLQVVFVMHIGTPLVKANDALLSFSLLFSLVVTFLCSIVFLGKPQHWSCMTSQVALALGFALCLSSIMGGYTLKKGTPAVLCGLQKASYCAINLLYFVNQVRQQC